MLERRYEYWHDREIRFDGPATQLDLAAGEEIIGVFDRVEDTKGNKGSDGAITLTNLRVMWAARSKARTNLSIGFSTVTDVVLKEPSSSSKKRAASGCAPSVCLSAKLGGTHFHFIFTSVVSASTEKRGTASGSNSSSSNQQTDGSTIYGLVSMAWKAYAGSRMYRDVRLRTALTSGSTDQLLLLPRESVKSQYLNFSNINSEEEYVGKLVLTNFRLVWLEANRSAFNVSVPYMQITGLRLQTHASPVGHHDHRSIRKKKRQQKSGEDEALNGAGDDDGGDHHHGSASSRRGGGTVGHRLIVVKTSSCASNYIFGFRSAVEESITEGVFTELRSLWDIAGRAPDHGFRLEELEAAGDAGAAPLKRQGSHHTTPSVGAGEVGGPVLDGGDVFEEAPRDPLEVYHAGISGDGVTEEQQHQRPPVYDTRLGLAVEKPRKGATTSNLWGLQV